MVCKPSVCDAQVKSYSWANPGLKSHRSLLVRFHHHPKFLGRHVSLDLDLRLFAKYTKASDMHTPPRKLLHALVAHATHAGGTRTQQLSGTPS